jgi:predicted amidohydrolase
VSALLALLALLQDPVPEKLRVALVSFKSEPSDVPDGARVVARNLERHLAWIDRAAEEKAEFVGFPELSLNGYRFSAAMRWLRLEGPELEALKRKAVERRLAVGAGLAEVDADGRRWNTHVVIGPDGRIAGRHRKIWLTSERGFTETGPEPAVFDLGGIPTGIAICADGSDYGNLKALAGKGARLIYGPHANTTGSTRAGWYRFRARWGGPADPREVRLKTSNDGPEAAMPTGGWIASLGVSAVLVNQAGLYEGAAGDVHARFASGAWMIGPDGATLAQLPASTKREDSAEGLLVADVPIPKR